MPEIPRNSKKLLSSTFIRYEPLCEKFNKFWPLGQAKTQISLIIQLVCSVFFEPLTVCLPVSSAYYLGKQFGPRSGPANRRACSGSKLFDILMVFLKEFFQKVNNEKKSAEDKKNEKLPSMQ